ncbi:MAG TPA: hypothetical protein VIV59_10740, partial [Anaeromyxobacteraceae bacterium]
MSGPPLSNAPGDTRLRRWGRRAVTVPAYLAALAIVAVLYLLALVPVLALDLAFRRRLAALRFLTALLLYLAFEVLGVAWMAALFLTGRATQERLFRLECWWATAILGLLLRLFGMKLEVRGIEAARPG